MNEPIFHPATAKVLANLTRNLPQSLLLSGPRGVGLTTAAHWLIGAHVIDQLIPHDSKGQPTDNGTIGVEMIRRLYEQTRSQTSTKRSIIIKNADRMSSGASAAFLKLLEEPTPQTHFILTSHQPQLLLPTIRSRVQHTAIQPLSSTQTDQFIASLGVTDPTKKAQLTFIASGLPAELSRLVSDDTYFQTNAMTMSDARDFLQADPYKKLLIVQRYRQDRSHAVQLVDAALSILHRSLSTKPQHGIVQQIERLLEVRERLAANGNAMLQLTHFVI